MQLKPGKSKARPNGNILSFFQKVQQPRDGRGTSEVEHASPAEKQESLFIAEEVENVNPSSRVRSATPNDLQDQPSLGLVDQHAFEALGTEDTRFNEKATPMKRRRVDLSPSQSSRHSDVLNGLLSRDNRSATTVKGDSFATVAADGRNGTTQPVHSSTKISNNYSPAPLTLESYPTGPSSTNSPASIDHVRATTQQTKAVLYGEPELKSLHRRGPFIDDSASDDDARESKASLEPSCGPSSKPEDQLDENSSKGTAERKDINVGGADLVHNPQVKIPSLKREVTSIYDGLDEFDGLDFDEDEFLEGEELIERRLMEEHHRLEMLEDGADEDQDESASWAVGETKAVEANPETSVTVNDPRICPICAADLSGLTDNVRNVLLTMHPKWF